MADKSIFGGAFEKKKLDNPCEAKDKKYYQWGGSGETLIEDKSYIKNDILRILAQDNAIGLKLRQENLIVLDDTSEDAIPVNQRAFFLIGVDFNGNDMFGEHNLVAAPCPPYCGGGEIIKK